MIAVKEYDPTRSSGGPTFGWECRNCGHRWFQGKLFTWALRGGRVQVSKADRKAEAARTAELHECRRA